MTPFRFPTASSYRLCANRREDRCGGSPDNRARLLLAITERVRAALPADIALGVRLTTTDWVEDGVDTGDAVEVARWLKALGVDYVCATGGFVVPPSGIPFGPGYQVHRAKRVRREAGIATRAVAGIADPRWAWRAADALGVTLNYPGQYARARGQRKAA